MGGAGSVGPAGFHVSGRPSRLPLTLMAVPTFSCAIRAGRAAAALIPAYLSITATVAPADSADKAASTATAGLSPEGGATDPDARFEAVSATLRAVAGAGFLAPLS